MRIILCILSILLTATVAMAQPEPKTVTIFAETSPSSGQDSYLEVLSAELREAGFLLADGPLPLRLSRGEIRDIVSVTEGALGLVYLEGQVGEGDAAAALLSAPGAFATLDEQRAAQLGVIGDVARDEIADTDVFALRLWPHSTDSLFSTKAFKTVEDLQGMKVVTADPFSIEFVTHLGAAPMQFAFAELYTGLQVGIAEAAVVPQRELEGGILDLISNGTVVSEHRINSGVTLVGAEWWTGLTAAEQRGLLRALDLAEAAAAETVQADTDYAMALTEKLSIQSISWQASSPKVLRSAVSAAIIGNAFVDPSPVLQLRDDIDALLQRTLPDSTPSNGSENKEEGALDEPARVFFASDRRYDDGAGSLADQFANAESPFAAVRCGELVPAEPADLGKVADAAALVSGSAIADGADCVTNIATAVAEAGGKLLIYVHGYRNSFEDAVSSGLAFARDIRLRGVLLVWSWPSGAALASYGFDEESVIWSEPQFHALVTDLIAAEGIVQIDFLAHSMGTRLVANLMRDGWYGPDSAVVLAAADVSRPLLKQAVQQATTAATTLLATEADKALQASRIWHRRPRAGRAKPLFLLAGIDTIDLSAFDHWRAINHGHAFSVPEVVADLGHLFRGIWRAADRGLEAKRSSGASLDHYVITPDGS